MHGTALHDAALQFVEGLIKVSNILYTELFAVSERLRRMVRLVPPHPIHIAQS